MTEWVAVVFVGFKLCFLEGGVGMVDPGGREIWIRPDRVSAFRLIPEQLSGTPCSQIQVGDRTVYVVGSPREVYGKLTEHD